MTDGICNDCGKKVVAGMWPFDCGGHGDHIMYVRLAVLGKGRTREFAPPMPLNPIDGPQITRDWMNADGTTRPMAPDEYNKNFIGHDA